MSWLTLKKGELVAKARENVATWRVEGGYNPPIMGQLAHEAMTAAQVRAAESLKHAEIVAALRLTEDKVFNARTNRYENPLRRTYSDIDKIGMRLNIVEGGTLGFDFISVAELDERTKVVFLVVNHKPVVLEDDAALFPSDALITQLRILRK